MKKVIMVLVALSLTAGWALAADKPQFKTLEDKISYIIGHQFGTDMKTEGIDIAPDKFLIGMKAGLAGEKAVMSEKEMTEAMNELRTKLMAEHAAKMKAQLAENKKKGDAFRAEYAKKKGVKTMPDGVMYRELEAGKGAKPGPTDVVKVNYTGKLIDGTVFDSSKGRGGPAALPLDRVIPGWSKALQQMPKGSKWEIVMPPELAYGDRQAGPQIGPGSTLVFEVELVDFQPAPKAKEPKAKEPKAN